MNTPNDRPFAIENVEPRSSPTPGSNSRPGVLVGDQGNSRGPSSSPTLETSSVSTTTADK